MSLSSHLSPGGHRLLGAAIGLVLLCSAAAQADPIAFQFNIVDPAGQGFNDPTLGAQRLAAVQYAAQFFRDRLPAAYAGETLHVDLSMDLPGTALAFAGNLRVYSEAPGLVPDTYYGASLANHLYGADIEPGFPDFTIRYSPTQPWYFGTDSQPAANQYDFVTATMHEIMHGLGFNSRLGLGTGQFEPTEKAGIYDRYLVLGPTGLNWLVNMTDAERSAVIRSDNIYWAGDNATTANGGAKPKLWAPATFAAGRSLTHLDASAFPTSLMRAGSADGSQLGEVNRPSLVELGMLKDLGWQVIAVPEPATLSLFLITSGIVCITTRRRGRRS